MANQEELAKVLDKIAETICIVSGNLLCPSYHGMIKYQAVNRQLREMRAVIKEYKESV